MRRVLFNAGWWAALVLTPIACSSSSIQRSPATDVLLEGAGLQQLRIGSATVADAARHLDIDTLVWMDRSDKGQGEITTPQLLRLIFRSPESGDGAAVLYGVRAQLATPIYDGETAKGIGYYAGKTSKGIGFLDPIEQVRAAYGAPGAEEIRTFDRIHYYAEEGLIIATQHPSQIDAPSYVAARAALGKQPDEGPDAAVVTGIMVVPPFTITRFPETISVGQRVVTSAAETTLRAGVF